MFDSFDWNSLFNSTEKATNKEAVRGIKETISAARKCLNSSDFVNYKNKYDKVEKEIVNLLITKARMFNGDIAKYGAEMLAILIRLDVLRALIKDTENDSKKVEMMTDDKVVL